MSVCRNTMVKRSSHIYVETCDDIIRQKFQVDPIYTFVRDLSPPIPSSVLLEPFHRTSNGPWFPIPPSTYIQVARPTMAVGVPALAVGETSARDTTAALIAVDSLLISLHYTVRTL